MTRRFDAVLFDLDGTLLDTRDLIVQSYQHTFRSHLGIEVPEADILAKMGHTLVDHFSTYPGVDVDALVATYRAFNLAKHDELTRIFPGVPETLEALKEAGVTMAVVSSKMRHAVRLGLGLYSLLGFFETAVCCEDTERHKPHPAPVDQCLTRLGVSRDRALMVGDSPFDIAAGRAAGVATVAVGWSSFSREELAAESPDYLIDAFPDLLRVILGKPVS